MTLVSEIIKDAFRESNLIATSGTPTVAEEAEGLRLLNRYIASVYGDDIGEKFRDLIVGRKNINRPDLYPYYDPVPNQTDFTVPLNTRLVLNLQAPLSVYLEPEPEDGSRLAVLDKSLNLATNPLTIFGNGRTIGGATSVTLSTNGAILEYVYMADTGDWSLVSPLILTDQLPFPKLFEDMFVIGLAIRLNPRHGTVLGQESATTYNRLLKKFKARYKQTEEVGSEEALLQSSLNRRTWFGMRRGNAMFNSGLPR